MVPKIDLFVCHSKNVLSIRDILQSSLLSVSHIALPYECIWSVNQAGSTSVYIDLNIYHAAVRVIWLKLTLAMPVSHVHAPHVLHPRSCGASQLSSEWFPVSQASLHHVGQRRPARCRSHGFTCSHGRRDSCTGPWRSLSTRFTNPPGTTWAVRPAAQAFAEQTRPPLAQISNFSQTPGHSR